MIVDLAELNGREFVFNFLLHPEDINLESDVARLTNSVKAQGKLAAKFEQFCAEGEIFANLEIDCSRCLQPTVLNLKIPFKVVFVNPENYLNDKEVELRTDDLDVSIIETSKIDLAETVREQLLLNLPTQIFCQKDCQGLCLKCGANKNFTDCNCEAKEIDPRWAKLKNLT